MSKEESQTIDARTDNMMIDDMHDQIQALCKRMDAAEGALTAGYIYPKTLPADAVIVIRSEVRMSKAAMDSIGRGVSSVWPDNKCIVLCDGLSMEIVEGESKGGGGVWGVAHTDRRSQPAPEIRITTGAGSTEPL